MAEIKIIKFFLFIPIDTETYSKYVFINIGAICNALFSGQNDRRNIWRKTLTNSNQMQDKAFDEASQTLKTTIVVGMVTEFQLLKNERLCSKKL